MDTRGNTHRNNNRAGTPGANAAQDDNAVVMGVVRAMIEAQQQQSEAQQQQNALLHEALLAAQKTSTTAQATTTAAIKKMTAHRELRTGNVTDFMRMNPTMFTGTETPLEAEKWITDMENLLKATKI